MTGSEKKSVVLQNSTDMAIIANGPLMAETLDAAEILAHQDISTRVINMATVKPLDEGVVLTSAKEYGKIITCEEHSTIGGLGEAMCAVIVQHGLACTAERMNGNDEFGHSGSDGALFLQFGLCAGHIAETGQKMCSSL